MADEGLERNGSGQDDVLEQILTADDYYLYLDHLIDQFIGINEELKKQTKKPLGVTDEDLINMVFTSYALSSIIEQYEDVVEVNLEPPKVAGQRKRYWEDKLGSRNKEASYVRLQIGKRYSVTDQEGTDLTDEIKFPMSGRTVYFDLWGGIQEEQLKKLAVWFGGKVARRKSGEDVSEENRYEFCKGLGFYANPYIPVRAINILRSDRTPHVYSYHWGDAATAYGSENPNIEDLKIGDKTITLTEKMKEYAKAAVGRLVEEVTQYQRVNQYREIAYKWVVVNRKPALGKPPS